MVIEEIGDFPSRGRSEKGFPALVEDIFASIANLSFPFLLDGGGPVPSDAGRFSFLGADPFMTLEACGDRLKIWTGDTAEERKADPLSVLEELLARFREEGHPLFPFTGGAVGYIGYETGERIESLPPRKEDAISIPDVRFSFYDAVIILDHWEKRVFVASTGFTDKGDKSEKRARERARFFRSLLGVEERSGSGDVSIGEPVANIGRDDYLAAVERVKGYIERGDVYQVNISQRLSAPFEGSSFTLYRRFRNINPVPFGAYLSFPDLAVASNSPERFLRLKGGIIETRPIKGTLRRSEGTSGDRISREALRMSVKDGAEHLMIVDLERNDLGRVCRYGTVRVREFKRIETYSNLHHMVSIIEGEVREGTGAVDCIRAAFPGGSITGAPKIRAMEIIHEVEPNPRWIYTGSIGYIGFDGTMDLNIAIRTAFVTSGRVFFSVGGGIVADSDPEREYDEVLLKGEVFRKAAGVSR